MTNKPHLDRASLDVRCNALGHGVKVQVMLCYHEEALSHTRAG